MAASLLPFESASARTPGSEDVGEAVEQIKDAAAALRKLREEWATYAVIDEEGRAGSLCRRVLTCSPIALCIAH